LSDCAKCHTPLPFNGSCSQCDTFPVESGPELDTLRQRLARALEGRYEIVRLLGRGGMAAVFLAQDLVLEREVAIKVLPPEMSHDAQLIRRFKQEAKTAAKLDHPNIIPIYRVESEAGLVYIVMKYVSGRSLEELASNGPLPIPRVRHILREAALALGHAHRRRVVHRDVKPANIMVDDDGRVILTDFGISKAVQSGELTGTGAVIGTPHYMAPEQARGHEVDGRTDQYALAIVGHRVLTGRPPFDGDAQAILYQQVFESPPSLMDRRPDTPPDLRRALDRALAKEAKSRFSTMEEFASAISGERSGPTTAVSPPVAVRGTAAAAGQVTGHGTGVFVALATAVLLAIVAWFSLPTLLTLTERKAADRVSPPTVSAPSRPRLPAASRPFRRQPSTVTSPAQERRSGSVKLRAVRYAQLKVESSPRGVVQVDGVEIGRTPITNYRIPLGTHRLRIERTGYRPQAEVIVVKGTAPITRKYQLQPASRR